MVRGNEVAEFVEEGCEVVLLMGLDVPFLGTRPAVTDVSAFGRRERGKPVGEGAREGVDPGFTFADHFRAELHDGVDVVDVNAEAEGGERRDLDVIYQAWYRNPAPFCGPSTTNLSNALVVAWTP